MIDAHKPTSIIFYSISTANRKYDWFQGKSWVSCIAVKLNRYKAYYDYYLKEDRNPVGDKLFDGMFNHINSKNVGIWLFFVKPTGKYVDDGFRDNLWQARQWTLQILKNA